MEFHQYFAHYADARFAGGFYFKRVKVFYDGTHIAAEFTKAHIVQIVYGDGFPLRMQCVGRARLFFIRTGAQHEAVEKIAVKQLKIQRL